MQLLNDNVKQITPKRITEVYRGKQYHLQFHPSSKRVLWLIPWTALNVTIHFHDYNASFTLARRSAKKKIDELLDGKAPH